MQVPFLFFFFCCLSEIYLDLQVNVFKKAIEDMAASSLRCVAIAYRLYEMEKVPSIEEELAQWALPEDNLVLLAIVGIEVYVSFYGLHSCRR